jgi:CheY-like chemotaxis protein
MKTTEMNRTHHYSVAVVEDSKADARLILRALLQDDRHLRVTVLTDGERASNHLRSPNWDDDLPFGPPDLVFLDLNLPGKDGLEVLAELKATPRMYGVPIIVFTGTEQTAEIQSCYELGANCVVTKPMDLEPFIKTVQSIERYWLDVVGPRARERAQAQATHGQKPPEVDEIP